MRPQSGPRRRQAEEKMNLEEYQSLIYRQLAIMADLVDLVKEDARGIDFDWWIKISAILRKVKPVSIAARFKWISEQKSIDVRTAGQRIDSLPNFYSEQIEHLCDQTEAMASSLRDIELVSISEHKIKELQDKISKFKSISNRMTNLEAASTPWSQAMKTMASSNALSQIKRKSKSRESTKEMIDGILQKMKTEQDSIDGVSSESWNKEGVQSRIHNKGTSTSEKIEQQIADGGDEKISAFEEFPKLLFELDPDYRLQMEEMNLEQNMDPPIAPQIHKTDEEEMMIEQEMDGGKSLLETEELKSAMEMEEEEYASYRRDWEATWGRIGSGDFQDITVLSPMHFTHCTPGCIPQDAVSENTMQIYSVEVAEPAIKEFPKLSWPLSVYGMVATRDDVDHNRNLLFHRGRNDCQILTKEDGFLRLTGPSRAIVSSGPVDFEFQLKVKGETPSEDIALITRVFCYGNTGGFGYYDIPLDNHFCTIKLSFKHLAQTVQATILGAKVIEGSSLIQYGGRILCSSSPWEADSQGDVFVNDLPSRQAVLVDSQGGAMTMGSDDYINLSRQVVSVELKKSLKVVVQAYSPSGVVNAQGSVHFTPQICNISRRTCQVGDSEVEITAAWSLLVSRKEDILMNGRLDEDDCWTLDEI